MLAHFGLVIPLAEQNFRIALTAAGELVLIQSHSESGLMRNFDRSVLETDAAAFYDLIVRGLPGIVRVAGKRQIRAGCRHMSHRHETHAQMAV